MIGTISLVVHFKQCQIPIIFKMSEFLQIKNLYIWLLWECRERLHYPQLKKRPLFGICVTESIVEFSLSQDVPVLGRPNFFLKIVRSRSRKSEVLVRFYQENLKEILILTRILESKTRDRHRARFSAGNPERSIASICICLCGMDFLGNQWGSKKLPYSTTPSNISIKFYEFDLALFEQWWLIFQLKSSFKFRLNLEINLQNAKFSSALA